MADKAAAAFQKIAALPGKLKGNQAGMQVAWRSWPRHCRPGWYIFFEHITSTTPLNFVTPYKWPALLDTVRQCIGITKLTAVQLEVDYPVSAGGLWLPHLPTLAFIACAAALATLPRAKATDSYRRQLLDSEGLLLFEHLRTLCNRSPESR